MKKWKVHNNEILSWKSVSVQSVDVLFDRDSPFPAQIRWRSLQRRTNKVDMAGIPPVTSRASAVIRVLCELFATHGIPDTVISDNGPQYANQEFKEFARDWGFVHVTSTLKLMARWRGPCKQLRTSLERLLTPNLAFLLTELLLWRMALRLASSWWTESSVRSFQLSQRS